MRKKIKGKRQKGLATALVIACLWIGMQAEAQKPVISASLDSTQILIGQQTALHLEIAANQDSKLQLPYLPDTLMQGVEVLGISKPDTTDIGNRRMRIKYDYLITSFDTAVYLLPPFRLIAESDTSYSNDLILKVLTVKVDTVSGKYYDIKNVMNPPFVLADYVDILFYILGICILILIVVYVIFRKRKQRPIFPFAKEEKVFLPPHVRAIQALDAIKERKLWQQGQTKEYHSLISDTIRKYLEERFDVNAMEMTSNDILQQMQGMSAADFVFNPLKQILLLADLVKFAKYGASPDENETSMMNAYLFVNGTAPTLESKQNEENTTH
ncbi:MAG: BatD family protein [Candidatus Azobacteroides sp.]|nr:BatD family protein [Candidatus Azobacteroides sp.]